MAKLIYPELSYKLTGFFYKIHNELGRYCKEKQYTDAVEKLFQESKIEYKREEPACFDIESKFVVNGNRLDFVVENKILIEIKAKRFITKEDYYQVQRYLKAKNLKLALLVNFRNRFLKPIRIIRINS